MKVMSSDYGARQFSPAIRAICKNHVNNYFEPIFAKKVNVNESSFTPRLNGKSKIKQLRASHLAFQQAKRDLSSNRKSFSARPFCDR